MKVRMIFGTEVDGEDWRAGREYEATAEQARDLIASGRGEPASPAAEAPSPKARKR